MKENETMMTYDIVKNQTLIMKITSFTVEVLHTLNLISNY